jgi:hypothetical protein
MGLDSLASMMSGYRTCLTWHFSEGGFRIASHMMV